MRRDGAAQARLDAGERLRHCALVCADDEAAVGGAY